MAQQKIIPNIWCNGNAREVAVFYVDAFEHATITGGDKYPDSQAEGLADFQLDLAGKDVTITLTIEGMDFILINAGAEFAPTPANSFFVYFNPAKDPDARVKLEALWQKLSNGGSALMPLQQYDWSELYGWIQDKFGVSWQLIMLKPKDPDYPMIVPQLMFGGPAQNRAHEASQYYQSVFGGMQGIEQFYPVPTGPATTESVMYSDFKLAGQWFAAMDSGAEQDFTFTEGVSYMVSCADQAEIDELWSKLSANPENEQCGWCKDKFGVSWQIVPANMGELMSKPDAFKTLMSQKKIIITEY